MCDAKPNVLNYSLFKPDNIVTFKKEFNNNSKPFPFVRVESFLNKEFIPKLESSIDKNITFSKKDNDLFRFYQSYDLQQVPANTAIQDLIKSLYSQEFIHLLFKITGIKVSDKANLFASCYNDASYLLCHDDQVEDRSIAFILYLVPQDWNETDGGALNIYNSYNCNPSANSNSSNDSNDSNDLNSMRVNVFPQNKPFKQLIPMRNSVVIFKVCDKSFHSVDEVLTSDKNRIAIGGWWHDEKYSDVSNVKINKIPFPDPMIVWNECTKSKNTNNLLQKWLNPIYLKDDSIKKLQEKFVEESHVTLISFINEELYYKLLKQMFTIKCAENENTFSWKLKGPIHRRLYYHLPMDNNGDIGDIGDISLVFEFKELMESIEWKLFIQQMTCLDLLKYNVEIRRFDHRHYTIAHDLDRFKDIAGLDVNIQFIEKEENGWDPIFGGSTYYTLLSKQMENENESEDEDEDKKEEDVDVDDEDEDLIIEENKEEEDENILMSVHTFPNTLSITYRSECGVMSFVKYINHNAPCSKIDFNQTWTVDDNDESDEDKNDNDLTDKKRKLDDGNILDSKDEPQHKRQKM